VWADLSTGVPDGICIDADRAVWYADVPNKRCVRVREGGEVLQTVEVDRGCFACMLGGSDRKTSFIIATEWRGIDKIPEVARARTGLLLTVEAPRARRWMAVTNSSCCATGVLVNEKRATLPQDTHQY
jgi:sugar lactone lactonase YvrE